MKLTNRRRIVLGSILLSSGILAGCVAGSEPLPRSSAGGTGGDSGASSASGDGGGIGVLTAGTSTASTGGSNDGEICGNGLDDNGNGLIDEGCPCTAGATQTCYAGDPKKAGVGACKLGTQTCTPMTALEFATAGWGTCVGQGSSMPEICNDGVDNDCNGKVDDGCPCKDGDTVACSNGCGSGEQVCAGGVFGDCSAPTPKTEVCNGLDDDCDGKIDDFSRACSTACGAGSQTCTNGEWSSCVGKQPTAEVCNGLDDDCDGKIDDFSRACSTACGAGSQTCTNGEWSSCSGKQPTAEVCNGIDDNCNGEVDEGLTAAWSFENLCSVSRIFIVFGGCNVCAGTCTGYWVDPGTTFVEQFAQNSCVTWSAYAATPRGNLCQDTDENQVYVGQTRQLCNGDCQPQLFTMNVAGGC